MNVGQKIKELREKQRWSQQELARRAKVPQSAIHYIEKGEREPSLATLRKLAQAFNVDAAKLI